MYFTTPTFASGSAARNNEKEVRPYQEQVCVCGEGGGSTGGRRRVPLRKLGDNASNRTASTCAIEEREKEGRKLRGGRGGVQAAEAAPFCLEPRLASRIDSFSFFSVSFFQRGAQFPRCVLLP